MYSAEIRCTQGNAMQCNVVILDAKMHSNCFLRHGHHKVPCNSNASILLNAPSMKMWKYKPSPHHHHHTHRLHARLQPSRLPDLVCPPLWPSAIGSRLGRNRLWVWFLAVSDIYPMFIEPTITWVPSGFSGYIWLDTITKVSQWHNVDNRRGNWVQRMSDKGGINSLNFCQLHDALKISLYQNWPVKVLSWDLKSLTNSL